MKNNFYLIIIFLITILFSTKTNALENKILFKIDNEIVTSLDILNEIKYLKIISKELQNIESEQLYEISKNSLIKEKIKKIELLKNFKKIEVDEKLVNDVLLGGFKKFNISSKNELFELLVWKICSVSEFSGIILRESFANLAKLAICQFC